MFFQILPLLSLIQQFAKLKREDQYLLGLLFGNNHTPQKVLEFPFCDGTPFLMFLNYGINVQVLVGIIFFLILQSRILSNFKEDIFHTSQILFFQFSFS